MRSKPYFFSADSVQTMAAAAPSEIGEHIGSVMGYVIGGAASTSSMLIALRYCERSLCTECPWFFDDTAASWRWVMPKRSISPPRPSAAYTSMNGL
ncbi:hypothetical protein D3C81_1947450 [compost metagenome]